MGHICGGGSRLGVFALLSAALVFTVFTSVAQATTPPSGTVSSTQTTQSFAGHVTGSNFLQPVPGVNPTPCPPQATDPSNLVCEHYTLTVQQAGTVTVCVSFPPGDFGLNDVDLYVVNNADPTVLVASSESQANPECVTFTTTGPATFEIRINPALVEDVAGFDISGSVTFQPSGGGAAGGGTPPSSQQPGNKFTGGGRLPDGGQFNINVFALSNDNKGKVKFQNALCAFRSDTYSAQIFVTGTDSKGHPTGKVTVTGNGFNKNQPATFTAQGDDNGEPGTNDDFSITVKDQNGAVVCSDSGTLTSGNEQVHPAT